MLDEPSTLSPATSHLISDYSLLQVHAMVKEVATNRSRGDVATVGVMCGLKRLLSPVFEPIPFCETGVSILVSNLQYYKRLPDRIPRQKAGAQISVFITCSYGGLSFTLVTADITEWWCNLLCELQAMQLFAIAQRDKHNRMYGMTVTVIGGRRD
jgi:hypothetical protein